MRNSVVLAAFALAFAVPAAHGQACGGGETSQMCDCNKESLAQKAADVRRMLGSAADSTADAVISAAAEVPIKTPAKAIIRASSVVRVIPPEQLMDPNYAQDAANAYQGIKGYRKGRESGRSRPGFGNKSFDIDDPANFGE